MKLSRFSEKDFQIHIKNNKDYYLIFLVSIIIGIILAVIVLVSSDAYLNLVISKNKMIYSFINGTASKGSIFTDRLIKFIFPLIIIFVLGLNYYFSLLSYLVVSYQFCILVLTISSLVKMYLVSAIIATIFLIIPINFLYFLILIFFSVTCMNRSKLALRQRYFYSGFDNLYFTKIFICILLIVFLAFFIAFILPMILKSAVFSIY